MIPLRLALLCLCISSTFTFNLKNLKESTKTKIGPIPFCSDAVVLFLSCKIRETDLEDDKYCKSIFPSAKKVLIKDVYYCKWKSGLAIGKLASDTEGMGGGGLPG